MEYTDGQIKEYIWANGKMESNMGSEYIKLMTLSLNMGFGKMENESYGLIKNIHTSIYLVN